MSMSSVSAAVVTQVASVDRTARSPASSVAELPRRAVSEPAAPQPSPADVEQASAQIEKYVQSAGRNLQFRVDADSGRVVVSVRDAETGELIRQIPNEAALRIAKSLEQGDTRRAQVLIDDKA